MRATRRCIREASLPVLAALIGVTFLLNGCGADKTVALDPGEASLASSNSPGMDPPSALTAVALSATRIAIAWQDNSTRETGFELQRSTEAGGTFTVLATLESNVTSYDNDGLTQLTPYWYRVRALRTTGGKTSYSAFSNTAWATTPAAPQPTPGPNAPSGVVAVVIATNFIVVTWVDNSSDEEWFRVEHSPTMTGPWTFVGTLLGSGYTSYTDGGAPSEQQRCYRVIALNAQGQSAPSNTACTTLPAAPSGLTAVAADGPRIDLTWSDNSSAEDGYQLQRATEGGFFSSIAELPANTRSYTDVNVSSGQTYSYFVRAKKDGGFSSISNYASVSVGAPKPPVKPSWAGQPEGYYLGTIWLVWFNVAGTVDSYKIERCDQETCAEADFRVIATVAASTEFIMSRQDGGADWTIYTYRLRATNQVGDSEPSDPVQGRACIEGVDWESPCFPPLPTIGTSEQRTIGLSVRTPVPRRGSSIPARWTRR